MEIHGVINDHIPDVGKMISGLVVSPLNPHPKRKCTVLTVNLVLISSKLTVSSNHHGSRLESPRFLSVELRIQFLTQLAARRVVADCHLVDFLDAIGQRVRPRHPPESRLIPANTVTVVALMRVHGSSPIFESSSHGISPCVS